MSTARKTCKPQYWRMVGQRDLNSIYAIIIISSMWTLVPSIVSTYVLFTLWYLPINTECDNIVQGRMLSAASMVAAGSSRRNKINIIISSSIGENDCNCRWIRVNSYSCAAGGSHCAVYFYFMNEIVVTMCISIKSIKFICVVPVAYLHRTIKTASRTTHCIIITRFQMHV